MKSKQVEEVSAVMCAASQKHGYVMEAEWPDGRPSQTFYMPMYDHETMDQLLDEGATLKISAAEWHDKESAEEL